MSIFSISDEYISHPLRQLAGFFLCLFVLYLSVSLLTFSPDDPSLNRSTSLEVQNTAGYVGALLADMALQILGLASVCFIFVPLSWGIKMLMGLGISFLWLRITLLLLTTVLLATLLAVMNPPAHWPILSGLGGTMGLMLVDAFPYLYDNTLFLIILAATILFLLGMAFGMHRSEWHKLGLAAMALTTYLSHAAMWPVNRFLEYRESRAEAAQDEGYDELFDEDEYEEEEGEEDEEDDSVSLHQRLLSALTFWRKDDDQWADEEELEEEDGEGEDEEYEEDEEEEPPARKKKAAVNRPKKQAAQQSSLELPKGDFVLPPIGLLSRAPRTGRKKGADAAALRQNAKLLEQVLQEFGVQGEITAINPGPVVTLYELEPAPGTKSARVIGLADDIARSMSATSTRIAVIPGRNAIGVELPNAVRETVYFRPMLESDEYNEDAAKLPLVLGKNIGGEPVIADLAKMPHLLVAGTTGSGKSVAINTMILSLLYSMTPDEVKFIMIDPKMLELSVYDNIPHLLSPVVTEPGKAVVALKWTVKEMENRYRLMSNLGVRNIDGYNKRIREARLKGTQLSRQVQTGFDVETGQPIIEEVPLDMNELPFIVVVVDEMADLMLVAGKDIEGSIQRLAQMARAAGIHIIMATQRPSVDVITGVIKANFPTRISFSVTSRIDSRTILGDQGAEQLLGMGDMLYMAGGGKLTRVHGPFVSDKEVEQVVAHLKTQGEPSYVEDVTKDEEEQIDFSEGGGCDSDPLYDQAVAIVQQDQKVSTSYIQRKLKIGYNRAASIVDDMESQGVISEPNHAGKREVL